MSPRRPVAVVVLALVATLLSTLLSTPVSTPAYADPPGRRKAASHAASHAPTSSAVGRPHRDYAIPSGSFFSYPNRSRLEKLAIRNRVLYTIQSVYGGPRTSIGTPLFTNGRIRIATWSFDDWAVAKSLVAARNRGVSVQVVAAADANQDNGPWHYLRKHLGASLYRPGYPGTSETVSFARQCRGSCRGYGGTPHAKYFLFDNVGHHHQRHIVVSTSMNLTRFAYEGQWNQAQVMRSGRVWNDFATVFRVSRRGIAVRSPYRVTFLGRVANVFFPQYHPTYATDPVVQTINHVYCTGSTAVGTNGGRTKVRVVNYAIYGDRGLWLARRLRSMWERGCDVAVIYSLMTKPVLSILRHRGGRGPVPMRQSITRNAAGEIVTYNHSKWMTIVGHWAHTRHAYVTFAGSANWANLAFSSDEQMQRIIGSRTAGIYLSNFTKTWRQRSSHHPATTGAVAHGRVIAGAVPGDLSGGVTPIEDTPPFGHGIFKHMTED